VNAQIWSLWLATCGLILSLTVIPCGFACAQGIVSNEAANGSVELSNISSTDSPEPVAVEATAGSAAADQNADSANAEVPKDPREQYRDKVMKEPEGPMSATSAVSRRYKRVDLATYRAAMLGAPMPQAGSSAAQ
jgi:hypothetical protein